MNEELRIYNFNNNILARENFVLALFAKRPFGVMSGDAREIFEYWLKLVPPDMLKWALIGTNSTKYIKVNGKALDRCRAMLNGDIAEKRNIYFEIIGPQPYGPDYRLIIDGYAKPRRFAFADETNLIEFVFPRQFCSLYGEDRFLEMAASIFDKLSGDSGYAAPALHYGIRGDYDEASKFISPLAFRHHGYDVPNNASTSVSMGSRCRGARWLTMLSYEMVNQVGGIMKMKARVAKGVEIQELSKGILLRAGFKPEIGDVNKGEFTPLVSSVAHAIESITYFHDNSILPLFGDDEDKRDRWERRFWHWEKLI